MHLRAFLKLIDDIKVLLWVMEGSPFSPSKTSTKLFHKYTKVEKNVKKYIKALFLSFTNLFGIRKELRDSSMTPLPPPNPDMFYVFYRGYYFYYILKIHPSYTIKYA